MIYVNFLGLNEQWDDKVKGWLMTIEVGSDSVMNGK